MIYSCVNTLMNLRYLRENTPCSSPDRNVIILDRYEPACTQAAASSVCNDTIFNLQVNYVQMGSKIGIPYGVNNMCYGQFKSLISFQ